MNGLSERLIFLGILLLGVGFALYVHIDPAVREIRSYGALAYIATALDPKLRDQVDAIMRTYYIAIALLIAGALSFLAGALRLPK
jgi:hypothetical protein